MKKIHFPINYFISCLNPQEVYNGRKKLGWAQMIFILIFLCALLCVPVSLNFANTGDWLANNIVDNVLENITDDDAVKMAEINFENGVMQYDGDAKIISQENVLIGQNLSENEIEKHQKAIVFYKDKWLLKDFSGEDKIELDMNYPQSFTLTVENSVECAKVLKSAFFSANKTSLIFSATLSVAFLVVVSVLLLLLGISFFLWLTKISKKSGIRSWKESVNMALNSLGAGAILSCIIGIFYFDISIMLMIFSLVAAMMLIVSFSKTKFAVTTPEKL